MKTFAYVLVIVGSIIGGFTLLNAIALADSAPQQAAGAAMALAWGVLPYCFARAIEKLGQSTFAETLDRYFERRQIQSPPPPPQNSRGINLGPSQKP